MPLRERQKVQEVLRSMTAMASEPSERDGWTGACGCDAGESRQLET